MFKFKKSCPLRDKKNIKYLLLLPVVLILLVFSYLVYKYISEENSAVIDVRVTNITGTSVSISWMTEDKSRGNILYSGKDSWFPILNHLGKMRAYDDRDIEEIEYGEYELAQEGEYYTHHVTIRGLEPNSRYYYRISTGLKTADEKTYYPSFETGPVIEDLVSPDPMYGLIQDENGEDIEDGILVYLTVYYENSETGITEESAKYSTISANGSYSFDVSNVRSRYLEELFVDTASGKKYYENVEAISNGYENGILQVDSELDQPASTLLLKKESSGSETSLQKYLLGEVYAEETTNLNCNHENDTGVKLGEWEECCACHKKKKVIKCEGKNGYDQFHWSACNIDSDDCSDMCPADEDVECANGKCSNPGSQLDWCESRYCDGDNRVCKEKYCDSDGCIQYKPGRYDTCKYGCEYSKCKDGEGADTEGGSGGTCANQSAAPYEYRCNGSSCGMFDADCKWSEVEWDKVPDGECNSCRPSGEQEEAPVGQEELEGNLIEGNTCSIDDLPSSIPSGTGVVYNPADKDTFTISDTGLGITKSESEDYACLCKAVDYNNVRWSCQNLGIALCCESGVKNVTDGDCEDVNFQLPKSGKDLDYHFSSDNYHVADFVCDRSSPSEESKWEYVEGTCKNYEDDYCADSSETVTDCPGKVDDDVIFNLPKSDSEKGYASQYTCEAGFLSEDGDYCASFECGAVWVFYETDLEGGCLWAYNVGSCVEVGEGQESEEEVDCSDVNCNSLQSYPIGGECYCIGDALKAQDNTCRRPVYKWNEEESNLVFVPIEAKKCPDGTCEEDGNFGVKCVSEGGEAEEICTCDNNSAGWNNHGNERLNSINLLCGATFNSDGYIYKCLRRVNTQEGKWNISQEIQDDIPVTVDYQKMEEDALKREANNICTTRIESLDTRCTGQIPDHVETYEGDCYLYRKHHRFASGYIPVCWATCVDTTEGSAHRDELIHEGACVTTGSDSNNLVIINDVYAEGNTSVNESGIYEVQGATVTSGSNELTYIINSEQDGLDIRFFNDSNENGQKDEGEEYLDSEVIKLVKKQDIVSYNFEEGWKLISFPLVSDEIKTAKSLLDSINSNGGYATHVATYRNGKWQVYSQRADISFSDDFNILPGVGYFIRVHEQAMINVRGNKLAESMPLELEIGWNLVGIYSPEVDYTADSLLISIENGGFEADTMTKWDNGKYYDYIRSEGISYGNDFKIFETGGYFVRLEGSSGIFIP